MDILQKYASLLVNYCVELKENDKLYIKTTTLAEPLVKEIYKEAIRQGANIEVNMEFSDQNSILVNGGNESQLRYISPFFEKAMKDFDAYIYIKAPFNLSEDKNLDKNKNKIRTEALSSVNKIYFQRSASRDLKRNYCLYPTFASAQEAGMSYDEYKKFVYNACKLYDEDPSKSWVGVRDFQQHIVDKLNSCTDFKYTGADFEISFSTKGRTWINSDGKTNMPSGEVYTSPVEDSVNGKIHFSYPAIYGGIEVEGVTLYVENGKIYKWEAEKGKEHLDSIFEIKGAKIFGEAAIGTNDMIDKISKNILFDEKMGGSVHMAIGQSYIQAGGKNESAVHWDMITDMKNGGKIYADNELIYMDGKFLI